MYTKKSLGQNFLRSVRALETIVASGEIEAGEKVLEIGPGEGVLTERLLAKNCRLIAVEKDDQLYELLGKKFEKEIASKQLDLIHDDILNFNTLDYKLEAGNYKLIANIPYNITGAILEKFLSEETQPSLMVLLVQKEVAERIVARDDKESILSISVKVYGTPHYVETVKAGSFVPAPKVDSAIIKIEQISKDFFQNFSEKDFFRLVKAGFQAKRKKLSSNLSLIIEKDLVLKTFHDLNWDENRRAEDLRVGEWHQLAERILK